MDKVVYMDGDKHRVLQGIIESESDDFVVLRLDNSTYRIGKKHIISIRQGEVK